MRQKQLMLTGKYNLYTLIKLSGLLLLSLTACSNGNSQNSIPSQSLQISVPATVPVFSGKPTSSVIYIYNNSDYDIDNISYTSNSNFLSFTSGGLRISSKSCNKIAAHSSCALEFTTPALSVKEGNVQGSALIKANFILDGKAGYSQQLINYSLASATTGLNISSDIVLQANQRGTIYLYTESGSYDLQTIQSSNPQITAVQKNNQILTANQVVAVELTVGEINEQQSVNFNLNYENQILKTIANSQFKVNVTPTANKPILISGQAPIINTTQSTNSQLFVYNSGNQSASLGAISATKDISLSDTGSDHCISHSSLAAGASCILYFTVPQLGGTGTIRIRYNSTQLTESITWYNSTNEALLQMMASPSAIVINRNESSNPITITAVNIGGYDLTNMYVPDSSNPDGGSGIATVANPINCKDSNESQTGTNLPVGGSCTFTVTLTDSIVETDKNLLLKIGGYYNSGLGTTDYLRSTSINYTSISSVPIITITNLRNNTNIPSNVMGTTPITFTATISGNIGDTSRVSAMMPNQMFAIITSTPAPCELTVGGATTSCNFSVLPWSTKFSNSIVGVNDYDPFVPNGTSFMLNATNDATITGNGVASNEINYSITTPYIYLAAPQAGSASESNYGVNWDSGRFINGKTSSQADCPSGQEVMIDTLTNLMWIKSPTNTKYTWENAQKAPAIPATYCGYTDWRLPTVNELQSLINFGAMQEGKTPKDWLVANGMNARPEYFWTSTRAKNGAFYVFFWNGVINSAETSQNYHVWAIRETILEY